MITAERSIGSGMRRIEALTGAGADAHLRARTDALAAVVEAAGAQTVEVVADRIRALQDELRETKRRLKAGGAAAGGLPTPADLAARADEIGPGVTLVAVAGPYDSMTAGSGGATFVESRPVLGGDVVTSWHDAGWVRR